MICASCGRRMRGDITRSLLASAPAEAPMHKDRVAGRWRGFKFPIVTGRAVLAPQRDWVENRLLPASPYRSPMEIDPSDDLIARIE